MQREFCAEQDHIKYYLILGAMTEAKVLTIEAQGGSWQKEYGTGFLQIATYPGNGETTCTFSLFSTDDLLVY